MSVPLDRLYHFLQSLCDRDDIIIYRYFPHGSKNILDCWPIQPEEISEFQRMISMHMVCHDQEPLSLRTAGFFHRQAQFVKQGITYQPDPMIPTSSFKVQLGAVNSVYDEVLLVHSEANSDLVQHYSTLGCRPVYYWSHALIAHDWYRFAQHDPELVYEPTEFVKDFVIYNRAWSGTREYRLKLAEMLVQQGLHTACNMRFNPMDSGVHYERHQFVNPGFQISTRLERCYPLNTSDSSTSADYCGVDYQQAGLEVVLETLFDDHRNHLTEKTLRPIACAKPFMLVSTPGSLAYLKQYGFETFGDIIDESYDQIQDPVARLRRIVQVMQHIHSMPATHRLELWHQLHQRALRNQQRFFSKDFFAQVVGEFQHNLQTAILATQQHRHGVFTTQWLATHSATLSAWELGTLSNLINAPSHSAAGGLS